MPKSLTPELPRCVEFTHPFFRLFDNAYFRTAENGTVPVYVVQLGEQTVTLPLSGIKREYGFAAGSPDDVMLDTVESALRFVKALRAGDPIPTEVLTGEASWDATPAQREIAAKRAIVQLVSWSNGEETRIVDPAGLDAYSGANVDDEAIRTARASAAEALGLGIDGAGEIAELTDRLAAEMAYIEALREKFLEIRRIDATLRAIRARFARQSSVTGEIDPVVRLLGVSIRDLGQLVARVETYNGEIVRALTDIDAHCSFIRTARDDLYVRMIAWDDMLDAWRGVTPRTVDPYVLLPLLREAHKFLAPRFMPVDEWILRLVDTGPAERASISSRELNWFVREGNWV